LERERLAQELRLPELESREVDAMVRAIFKQRQPIRGDFLSTLVSLTEGNPFFVEEILKSLVTSGAIYYAHGQWDRQPLGELHIPRTVQVAVQQRADMLSPDAQQLLKLAAVVGRRFDFALLQRVTGHDEATLLQLIKSLLAVQLVVEESTETFAFRHALTREALYADVLARERKALHGRIALALEEIAHARGYAVRDVIVADLSYHYYAAEHWLKALEYAQQGAERAVRLHAPRPAIEHLSRAIEAARRLSMPVPPALHRVRGQMYELLGEFEQARDEYEQALGCAEQAGDARACGQALLALGLLWASRDNALMGDYLRRALELARGIGDPLLLRQILNTVGNW
jgi:adenylate cyclase